MAKNLRQNESGLRQLAFQLNIEMDSTLLYYEPSRWRSCEEIAIYVVIGVAAPKVLWAPASFQGRG